MRLRIILFFLLSTFVAYAGAGFENDKHLIWIGSHCPVQSKTCTDVTLNYTDKRSGKHIVIKGGEPIVGTLSANLLGYTFREPGTRHSYELSMDLNGVHFFFIRGFSRTAQKEQVMPFGYDYQEYLNKLTTVKNKTGK